MGVFNGVSLILNDKWAVVDGSICSDACLTGGGAMCGSEYLHFVFPDWMIETFSDINQLECFVVFVALKTWGSLFRSKKLLMFCDNENSVRAVNSGFSRDCQMCHTFY